jgi:protease-4
VVIFHSLGNLGKKKAVKIEPNSYLELKLAGEIRDYNELKDDFLFSPMQKQAISANDIVLKINKAAKDKNISGIILEPNWIKTGFATANELVAALENFKSSGKKVYAYLEMCGNKDYYLATVADSIYLNPSASAGILLTGIGGNILFYKELLDKLGIEMEVIHAGKYKGAGEPFSRNQMSEPFRESVDELFSDIYRQMLAEISKRRNIAYSKIHEIYEKRDDVFINKENAINLHIADELASKTTMMKKLNIAKKNLIKFSDYKMPIPSLKPEKIAVIFAQGGISQAKSEMDLNISAAKFNKILDRG